MKKPIVHFEIGCPDIPETADFYRKVFDWEIAETDQAAAIKTGGEQAIPGHLNALGPDGPQNYVTFYIQTDSLESDLQAIEENGGKKLVGPIPLPDGRSFAWFQDNAGNTLGLITVQAD